MACVLLNRPKKYTTVGLVYSGWGSRFPLESRELGYLPSFVSEERGGSNLVLSLMLGFGVTQFLTNIRF